MNTWVVKLGGSVYKSAELSHWLMALMNEGKYNGKQGLPLSVLKATLQPAIALANAGGEALGYWELLNSAYGMGRWTASYRGKLLTYHGGDLPGGETVTPFDLTVIGLTANDKVYDATTTATLNTANAVLAGVFSGMSAACTDPASVASNAIPHSAKRLRPPRSRAASIAMNDSALVNRNREYMRP